MQLFLRLKLPEPPSIYFRCLSTQESVEFIGADVLYQPVANWYWRGNAQPRMFTGFTEFLINFPLLISDTGHSGHNLANIAGDCRSYRNRLAVMRHG